MWLVKTDASGDSLWSKTYGGSAFEGVNSVIQTNDGGYLLAGGTDSFGAGDIDMWLVKTNSLGDSLWSRTYGGYGDDLASSVIQTGDGGYLLAGGTVSFGTGDGDMWLVKTNASGDSLWSKTYGGSESEGANSVIQTNDGGYLLAGGTGSFGTGYSDMWVVKTNALGDSLWSKTYGGIYNDGANCLIQTSDGGYLIAGWTLSFGAGGENLWLVKTNAWGDSLWSRTYGGYDYDAANSVISTSDGGYLLAGGTNSFGSGFRDIWLVKTNAAGDSLWSKTYGGVGYDRAFSVVQTSDGAYLLAGWTDSFSAGEYDMWLVCAEGPGTSVEPKATFLHPSSFILHPPHPNPFNATTVASFELPVASHVDLRIYDTSGRLVATLVDGWKAAGKHQAIFDPKGAGGSDLPSGIYLAKLTAGDHSQVQKLVLLK